jgi:acyl carrier protein
MASTEDRIRKLAQENLGLDREVNFDTKLSESGVSSVDVVAFIKVIEKEFDLTIPSGDLAQIQGLRGLTEYLDTHAG